MIGEWTEKINTYKNIIKNNDIVTNDGEVIELHNSTLESLAMDFATLEEQRNSSKDYSEGQIESMKKKRSDDELHQELYNEYGSFYFNFYKRINIERQFLFRFIYLCTYLNYDNYLSDGRRLLKEDSLQLLLGIKQAEYYKTLKYLTENKLISIDDKSNIIINPKMCKKGEINKTKSIEVVRMFDNAIRELYENSLPREHKKLAILIELLPYVNLKYNVLCENPKAESLEHIKPLKMTDVCEILGMDKTNSSKLKRDLFALRANNEEVIGMWEKCCGKAIFINPRVYYKGTQKKDVKFLQSMFDIG